MTVLFESFPHVMILLFQLGCCGVVAYDDWYSTPWGRGHSERLPHSCCLLTQAGVCSPGSQGAQVYQSGCYNLLVMAGQHNLAHIVSIILVVALVHMFGVSMVCCLAKNINNTNYHQLS